MTRQAYFVEASLPARESTDRRANARGESRNLDERTANCRGKQRDESGNVACRLLDARRNRVDARELPAGFTNVVVASSSNGVTLSLTPRIAALVSSNTCRA